MYVRTVPDVNNTMSSTSLKPTEPSPEHDLFSVQSPPQPNKTHTSTNNYFFVRNSG